MWSDFAVLTYYSNPKPLTQNPFKTPSIENSQRGDFPCYLYVKLQLCKAGLRSIVTLTFKLIT